MSDRFQNESEHSASESKCSQCSRGFICEVALGRNHCWCMKFPRVMPVDETSRCLCPDCLSQAIIENQQQSAERLSDGET